MQGKLVELAAKLSEVDASGLAQALRDRATAVGKQETTAVRRTPVVQTGAPAADHERACAERF